MPINYDRIPEELRWDRSWCVAGPDENTGRYRAPYGFGRNGMFHVSPVKPHQWKDFESVVEFAQLNPPCGIGYVLSETDAYSVIDLDIKNEQNEPDHTKWTSQEQIDRYHRIINSFGSYTERSASGLGFHIWVAGKIGDGLKRDGVEIYSRERFIVCTGDVYLDKPIEKRQELLELLAAEISQGATEDGKEKFELVEIEPTESDAELFKRAATADNGDKFKELCEGHWEGNYPSQSEADLALMSIFTFYSKSNSQCRRMFRMTRLGERPKATKNDRHIDLILRIIRSRQANEELVAAAAEAAAANLLASLKSGPAAPASSPATATQATAPSVASPAPPQAPTAPQMPERIPLPEEMEDYVPPPRPEYETREELQTESSIDWPPGCIGEVAKFIYWNSPRPVKEVSIVAALGFFAGVCGKAWNIPQSGLNLYIVLIARSAIGKEAMHSGVSSVIKQVAVHEPACTNFVDFSDYASGPALTKAVSANNSFLNVSGEWGRKLRRLSMEDGRDGPMQQLRTAMTNLYQKSGSTSIVGGIGYSDKEKNVAAVSGAAYSMIGESTPGGFYDSLTDSMMEDGFLSRFTIIEYTGERPPNNTSIISTMQDALCRYLGSLSRHAISVNSGLSAEPVNSSEGAKALLDAFDLECDNKIRAAGDDESTRQMWNRAHLKAYRIAALLAIADGFTEPLIQAWHVEWAIALIRKDIAIMERRILAGDVGVGDAPRERKLLTSIHKYLTSPIKASYGVPTKMHSDGIVPRKFLQIATQRSTAFSSHRLGQNGALDLAIKSLIDSGYLQEVAKDKLVKNYGFHGKAYLVVNLPDAINK